tara:strand:- start:940 stop:1179 length:240 start_codon:yes stop_codon:yes gene_type:complete
MTEQENKIEDKRMLEWYEIKWKHTPSNLLSELLQSAQERLNNLTVWNDSYNPNSGWTVDSQRDETIYIKGILTELNKRK